jgi:hypothetical protein
MRAIFTLAQILSRLLRLECEPGIHFTTENFPAFKSKYAFKQVGKARCEALAEKH